MQQPKISIITATYNSSATIQTTINSYIKQDYPNKELIIIDGQSTDGTVEIIKENEKHVAYWISEKDDGIPDALNKGMRASTGEWFYFLNSDDVFYSTNTLSRVFLKDINGQDMIYGDVILKSTGRQFNGEYDIEKLMKGNICHQAQFFNKSIITKIGYYNIEYKLLSDYDYTIRAFTSRQIQIAYIAEIIAIFDDAGRTSFGYDKAFWRDRKKNFIKRCSGLINKRLISRAFKPHFYYTLKHKPLLTALYAIAETFFYSHDYNDIKAGLSILKKRLLCHLK